MIVRSGWSSEYAKKKYDVELDEGDLLRILTEAGLPGIARGTLTLGEVHAILWCTAEILARQTLVSYDPSLKQQLTKEARDLRDKRTAVLEVVKARWNVPADAEEESQQSLQAQ
jgi:hypothetical protein